MRFFECFRKYFEGVVKKYRRKSGKKKLINTVVECRIIIIIEIAFYILSLLLITNENIHHY